ncbi:hypothetical protein [Oleiharenicola lentus]|uniref:hypothetical protein n=1 Tax=Oleiharenicola lentus TaxID=2508720 RepID=UPI003F6638BD
MKFFLTRKMMLLATASAFAGLVDARAQAGENSVRAEAFYASSRVMHGVERANASALAALEFSRDQFRARAETSQPFERDDCRDYSLAANYTWPVSGALSVEFFAAHTWFENVPGGGVDRAFEAGVAATLPSLTLAEFSPTISYARDFRFDADTTQLTLARSIALTKLGAFLEVSFFAGWSAGDNWRPDANAPARVDGYAFWGGEVVLPYHVGRYALELGLHYTNSDGRSRVNGPFSTGSEADFWVTFGVTREF